MAGAIPPSSWPSTKRAVCLEYPDTPEWTALITGVLLQLSFGYYWDKDYANWEDARNVGSEILQSWFKQTPCNAGAIPIAEPQCDDYPNSSPMLDWQPANPFLSPGEIPPGYIAQPWGIVGNPPVLTYQPGDVISGLFGLPVLTPALGQGLARVRIKFTGSGTVEVHLIKVALGGIALLTWDDNPFTATFVDTSMDFLALPPESGDEDIQEIEFETDGDHHIDVTMLPKFTTEAGFVGYGGGIRKVVLCGPDMQVVDRPPASGITDEFPGPDAPGGGTDVAICDVLRWNNGQLEVWCCNEWQPVPAIGTGAAPSPTQPPPSSPPSTGDCVSYNVSLNGNGKWLLPFPVNAGDTILVSNPVGGWSDGTLSWFCPTGKVYEFGACAADQPADPADPMPSGANHMQLIAEIAGGTGFVNILGGTYIVPVGVTDEQLTIQANDSTLADNSGTVQFTIKVCSETVATWASVYDYALGQLLWTIFTCAGDCGNGCNSGPAGTFSGSQFDSAYFPCSVQRFTIIDSVSFDPSYITTVEVTVNTSAAIPTAPDLDGLNVLAYYSGAWHQVSNQSIPGTGVQVLTATINLPNVEQIRVGIFDQASVSLSSIDAVTINGLGVKPSQLL